MYSFRLFIAGESSSSLTAIATLQQLCDQYLDGRYSIEIVDIFERPQLAEDEGILATPTLVIERPIPVRRIIGDLSNEKMLMAGLQLDDTSSPKDS